MSVPDKGDIVGSIPNVPLARSSVPLDAAYVGADGDPLSWPDAVRRFLEHHDHEQRFGRRWGRRVRREWYDRDRALLPQTETTVMLTLTASPQPAGDVDVTPVDHLRSVSRGRKRAIEVATAEIDSKARTGWVLTGQESGYSHAHVGLWCPSHVDQSDLKPAIDAHVRECYTASKQVHDPDDVITVWGEGEVVNPETATEQHEPVSGLAGYLVHNIPGTRDGVVQERAGRLAHATALDAFEGDGGPTRAYRRPFL